MTGEHAHGLVNTATLSAPRAVYHEFSRLRHRTATAGNLPPRRALLYVPLIPSLELLSIIRCCWRFNELQGQDSEIC
uniref:Uncharacterized protein n=1 Tax=Arundo donax TaxID=35708 RepID=A0A0A8YA03_ARUDO